MQFGQIERLWFEDLPLQASIDPSAIDLQQDKDENPPEPTKPPFKPEPGARQRKAPHFLFRVLIRAFQG